MKKNVAQTLTKEKASSMPEVYLFNKSADKYLFTKGLFFLAQAGGKRVCRGRRKLPLQFVRQVVNQLFGINVVSGKLHFKLVTLYLVE